MLILGGLAASGSLFTGTSMAFGNFGGTNFEADSIIASSSANIEYISTFINNDAARVVDSFNTSSYNGAIYDYVLRDAGVGCRTGQLLITQDNNNIDFTDISTKAIGGDSSIPSINAIINGGDIDVQVISGSGYTFKSLTKKL
jgi:hypothetical protein